MPNAPLYNDDNPHPLSQRITELIWEGKYDVYGNRRAVSAPGSPPPMQRIETIDAPRDYAKAQGLLFEPEVSHRDDFRNRLLWGDNKLILAALRAEFSGRVNLIYIDPPFDVGADFTLNIELGDGEGEIHKEQSLLEAVAYRDMWGKGTDSYLHMMYERLTLLKDLLAEDGSIYVHCDWRINAYIRLIMDDIFGRDNFVNQITWKRTFAHGDSGQGAKHLGRITDTIFLFKKSENFILNSIYVPYEPSYIDKVFTYQDPDGRKWQSVSLTAPGGAAKGNPFFEFLGVSRYWQYTRENLNKLLQEGKIYQSKPDSVPRKKMYLDESKGVPLQDVWNDIAPVQGQAIENVNYATQKPQALLERIIKASSNEGDLVLDCFAGSGTTLAVAEKLGRRWIGCDLGRYAIHTARKRLIGVQRELHQSGKPYRSFDVFNLGRYERQWWQQERLKGQDTEHRRIVLEFFKAAPLHNPPSPLLHATKGKAYVSVDGIDGVLTFAELNEIARDAASVGAPEIICLAWEFEMNLKLRAKELENLLAIKIGLKYIPREIMEANRSSVQFFDAAALEAKAIIKGKSADVELLSFYPALTEVPGKELAALQERAIKSPFDFIDFWAIDFQHAEGKPFEHHWQDFRTRKDRTLKTKSDAAYEYASKGAKQICVKVIDVFGVDTSIVIEAKV